MYEILKDLREYHDLTQQEVADALKISRSTYAGYESGKDVIPLKRLNDFANFYHTTIDYLVGNSPTMEEVLIYHTFDRKQVAQNLKSFRETRNITQEEIAEKIKVSQSCIHKYETNKILITTYYTLEFSKQYHYSLDELLGRKNN